MHAGRCPILMVDFYDAEARGPGCDSVRFYPDCRPASVRPASWPSIVFGDHASFPRNTENLHKAFNGRLAPLPEIDAGK